MFVKHYLEVATHLFEQYNLNMPLPAYLKAYFRNNKKFGSRDRKYISELLFGAFRLPPTPHLQIQDRLLLGSFLSHRLPVLFFEKTSSELAERYADSLTQKLDWVKEEWNLDIFSNLPFSKQVTSQDYATYFFKPKRFFIRLRKNGEDIVQQLKSNNISFKIEHPSCISFPEKLDLKNLLPKEEQYVVQDIATQSIGQFFNPEDGELWWDCCAASGGKSLMLLDKNKNINVYLSDIRPSILENLIKRLSAYNYQVGKRCKVLDASKPVPDFLPGLADKIICDVPCSGSGTWAQSPEQFFHISPEKLNEFHALQYQIAYNTLRNLKVGGTMFYITCSVFNIENEKVVEALSLSGQIKVHQQIMINSSEQGGDFIFLAILHKVRE